METREMVRYGERNVKLVITEIAGAEAQGKDGELKFMLDFSLAKEYEKLGLHKQEAIAKNEARTELLKKFGFRLLSYDEILKIGRYYANKVEEKIWLSGIGDGKDNLGGITSGLWARNGYTCNPWVKFEEMDTELIPLRVAKTLTTLKPLFDSVYIASTAQVNKSMVYQSPVAVGIVGKNIVLLARWGDYPPFLDCIKESPEGSTKAITPGNFFWKLDAALGRIFSQKG